MLEQLRRQLAALMDKRAAQIAARAAIVAGVESRNAALPEADRDLSLTEDETRQVTEARTEEARLTAEIEPLQERVTQLEDDERRDNAAATARRALPAYDQVARTGSEPRTYSPQTETEGRTFFGDAYRSQFGDAGAAQRLQRHQQEALVERESRATTTGSYAGLVVPQYLVGLYAPVLRPGRPLANSVNRLPLPEQGTVLRIPRATTGASAASQAAENTSVSNTDQVDADLVINMVTIAGQQDISRQSLERGTPGIDRIVYQDLARAYCGELDRQVANGSGTSGQMLGILQTSGRLLATAFGAPVTATTLYSKTAGAIAGIAGAGSMVTASMIAVHPRRWGWMTAQVDAQGRPLVVPIAQGPFNAQGLNTDPAAYSGDGDGMNGGVKIVGYFQGLPVITDANIPINAGGGGAEDVEIVYDQTQALLWEQGDGMPTELRFEQTLGNQLTTKLVVYGYAAFTAGRYPQAFAQVGGQDATAANGLNAPTF